MSDTWFTEYAEELARCLVDAEACADACEELLARVADTPLRQAVVDAVIARTAVARVLIELVDQPSQLVLAATRLCRDTAQTGIERLEALDGAIDVTQAAGALGACAGSCSRLVEAAA